MRQTEVKRAYELLETYGPATAYDYLRRVDGLLNCPSSLTMTLRVQIQTRQQRRRLGASSSDGLEPLLLNNERNHGT